MTIQEQIDQLRKELSGITGGLEKKIEKLQDHIAHSSEMIKPTRYYPNGAYMDEPEDGTTCYSIVNGYGGIYVDHYCFDISLHSHLGFLDEQEGFPTKQAAEREINRQKLTAKMYRDMRDERINGDWVAKFEPGSPSVYYPKLKHSKIHFEYTNFSQCAHNFFYKNDTFIEDLKAMGWTEEELKIVWFNK